MERDWKQVNEDMHAGRVPLPPLPWTVQIIPPTGTWYARYAYHECKEYFPILAWSLEESEYKGQKFRDVVGIVYRFGCTQSAERISDFDGYCTEQEREADCDDTSAA